VPFYRIADDLVEVALTHGSRSGWTVAVTDASADGGDGRQLTDQGRERKQQLVDAAETLFSSRGYAATRIADICEAAGVAKGLFYWYFPTKQALFEELVRTMRRRLRVAQAEAMDAAADPVTRLRQGTEASVRFIAAHASYFALVDVERTDPKLAATVAAVLEEGSDVYLRDVLAIVREAQADGAMPDVDPRLASLGVLGAVSSFGNAWRNGRIPDLDADSLAEFVGEWVVRALGAPSRVA
jgi:TetR/AcrR family transcriptional regulator, cholesterol catabolism regulator